MNISVGDIVNTSDRFWRVTGVYLGATGQEDTIGLEIADGKKDIQTECGEMIVPLALVENAKIYKSTNSK